MAQMAAIASRAENAPLGRLGCQSVSKCRSARESETFTLLPGSLVCSQLRYYRNAPTLPQGTLLALSPRTRRKIEQFFNKLGGSATRESNQPRPQLCPACRTLVGAGATRCHQCGANMRFSMAAASRSLGRFMPATSPATYVILTFSCLMYGVTLLLTIRHSGFEGVGGGLFNFGGIGGEILERVGASLPYPVDVAQPWRLVTA